MTARDLVEGAFGNIWRMKLRSALTIAGVLIAIAAFTAMLSFGAGGQQYINDQFEEFDLFSIMRVLPGSPDDDEPEVDVAKLDDKAIEQLSRIPGVRNVYPLDAFKVTVYYADTSATVEAQGIPLAAARTKTLSRLTAGTTFESDTASQIIISEDFLRDIGYTGGDSILGQQLIVETQVARLDSGVVKILQVPGDSLRRRLNELEVDSLFAGDYARRLLFREMSDAVARFIDGLLNSRATMRDTLTVCGISPSRRSSPINTRPVLITSHTAQRLNEGKVATDPEDLFYALSTGSLTGGGWDFESRVYPRVSMDVDPHVPYGAITDSVEALGFRVFSFAREFEQVQKMFLFFDLGLAGVGLIALITASLGIANTLIMSILERRREIGVLKALGADDSDIRIMFLVEAACIGVVGSVLGIVTGWLITRLVSFIGRLIMRANEMPEIELFALPLWLIGLGLAFGIIVSLAAGYYPAMRAARLDPVTALRDE